MVVESRTRPSPAQVRVRPRPTAPGAHCGEVTLGSGDESEHQRPARSLGTIAHPELAVDDARVLLDGVAGQVESGRHLGVAEALDHVAKDVELARGQVNRVVLLGPS